MSALSLQVYAQQIGSHTSLEAMLSSTPLSGHYTETPDYQGDVLSMAVKADNAWLPRVVALVESVVTGQTIQWQDAPVILLLPEALRTELPALFKQLQTLLPPLQASLSHSVFPYGRSAALMSMNTLIKQLNEQPLVWVIGIDTHPFFVDGTPPAQGIPAESVFIVAASRADEGLVSLGCHHEWSSHASQWPTVSARLYHALFNATSASTASLDIVYPPYSLNDELVLAWSTGLEHAERKMTEDVSYLWSSSTVGDIGANLGLLQWLSMAERYKQNPNTQPHCALQICRSDKGYQSGAIMGWRT